MSNKQPEQEPELPPPPPPPKRSKGRRAPTAKKVPAEKEEETAKPFAKPAIMMPTSDAAVLNNLVCRELINPTQELSLPSPTIEILRKTIEAITTGSDISAEKEKIAMIAMNQPEKADVIMSQLNQINSERIPRLVTMRDQAEREIERATKRGDMTVGESLVVWKLANSELKEITATLPQNKSVDTAMVVQKIDFNGQKLEASLTEKYEYTSPQGREIIRKKLWELKRVMVKPTPQDIPIQAEARPVEPPAK